jgi:tRNA (guanosine-2'-O-)-methyltransferase
MLDQADEFLKIPMHGFTDSFNISVSAAVILHHLTLKLHDSEIHWELDEKERDELMIRWLRKSIKHLRGEGHNSDSNLD